MMDREGLKGLRGKSSIEKLAELMQDENRREGYRWKIDRFEQSWHFIPKFDSSRYKRYT